MSSPASGSFIDNYFACFENTWSDDTPAQQVRFVLLDSETTGLNPRKDRLFTIGAVAVKAGQIVIEDSFEVMLQVAYNNASVTVHGITREEAQDGATEPEALEEFLGYLRDGVIVGHHIGHDVEALNCACERNFGIVMKNRFLDTMDLTLHLEKDGAFADQPEFREFSLDALCHFFGVAPHDRHTAGGDAFLTAQVFLRLLRAGTKVGRTTLGRLAEPWVQAPSR
jgi:DNA polymerase-3 subunit epsilon